MNRVLCVRNFARQCSWNRNWNFSHRQNPHFPSTCLSSWVRKTHTPLPSADLIPICLPSPPMHPILAGDSRSPYSAPLSSRIINIAAAGDIADTAEPAAAVCRLEASRCSCRSPDPPCTNSAGKIVVGGVFQVSVLYLQSDAKHTNTPTCLCLS